MRLLERFLGHPWVFDHVRPLVVGGIDMSPAFRELRTNADSVVLDVGCGTGNALTHLHEFASYLGLDTDPTAIQHASQLYADRPNVRFECRRCTPEDLTSAPITHVSMVGLLHHLSDDEAIELLAVMRKCPTLVRVTTLDIVYLPRRYYNNLLARFDRGRFCRTGAEYVELVKASGLKLEKQYYTKSHPTRGLVMYFGMDLTP